MATWDAVSNYYSGQGVVMIGTRDETTGKPKGLMPVGNVSDLRIAVATSVLEHKESQSGQRSIDLRLTTETKCNLTMTMESFNADNLAIALRSSSTSALAGSVSAEAVDGYLGKVNPLSRMKISSLVVERGATALTAYVDDDTPFDYKVNLDAGSFWLNDGSVQPIAKLTTGGTAPSAITVSTGAGLPTKVTVTNTASIGSYAVFSGFTGADAATLNGKAFRVTTGTTTSDVFLDVDTFGKTITLGTPLSFFDGGDLTADFNFAAQTQVDALTEGATDYYLRFEGLNTADANEPVVVEVFKFSVDPLKELALIGDGVQQFVLEGNVLADSLQTAGSKYFKQTLLS